MSQDTAPNVFDFPMREYGIQGRWPSPDPAGLAAVDPTDPQSWNRYAYVRNSPLEMIDPYGLHGGLLLAPATDSSTWNSWLWSLFLAGEEEDGPDINPTIYDENGDPTEIDDPGSLGDLFIWGTDMGSNQGGAYDVRLVEPLPFSATAETRDFGRLKFISPDFTRVSRTLEHPTTA